MQPLQGEWLSFLTRALAPSPSNVNLFHLALPFPRPFPRSPTWGRLGSFPFWARHYQVLSMRDTKQRH